MEIALFLCENMFGAIKPEIVDRLQAVIDNPCQETWEDTHNLIISKKNGFITLWQAVGKVDWNFPNSKPHGQPWAKIPTREVIVEAIKREVGME